MTELELIKIFREVPGEQTLVLLSHYFKFDLKIIGNVKTDSNLEFRAGVVQELLQSFTLKDIVLVRALFKEELACDEEIQNHDNLYQLCYYLYSLGQMEDVFILYNAKYNAQNVDTGLMLDRQCITVGHSADEVIAYIEKRFKDDIILSEKYKGLLAELNTIKLESDYRRPQEYKAFLDSYFNVKDDLAIATENLRKKRLKREEQKRIPLENAITDLNIFYKAFSFFVVIPSRGGGGYLSFDNDSILKNQQANYYLVTGVSFLIIASIVSNNYNVSFLLLWCAGFGLSYLFDVFYNRKRQIDDIIKNWPRDPFKLY